MKKNKKAKKPAGDNWPYSKWRRDKWRIGAWLGPLALLLGLLARELALGVVGYLIAYEFSFDSGSWSRRFLALLPYASVATVWLITYHLFGYGSSGSGLH